MPYIDTTRKIFEEDAYISVSESEGSIKVVIPSNCCDYFGIADFSLTKEMARALGKVLIAAADDV